MKENKSVHIICILDRSGSMGRLQKQVISNFNSFLGEQQAQKGKAFLTLILFDDKYEVAHNRVNIDDVKPIDEKTYRIQGGTHMYDAIGTAINSCNDKNTLVLIQTDGQTHGDNKFSKDQIMKMIGEKENIGWDFLFLGANIDTGAEGSKMGLRNKSISFQANDMGISDAYMGMGEKAKHYRHMKGQDDDYIPPKDSDLSKKNKNKGAKVKYDSKTDSFILA